MRLGRSIAATLALAAALGLTGTAPSATERATDASAPKEASMTKRASGTFEVKLTPLPPEDAKDGTTLGRMSIDKRFHGELEATSLGQMLTAITTIDGSAGYVAIERVSGKLHGRSGTFVLQHSGLMARGTPQQSVTVVPDSGTGQLTGLSGTMTIVVAGRKHSYEFDYSLSASR